MIPTAVEMLLTLLAGVSLLLVVGTAVILSPEDRHALRHDAVTRLREAAPALGLLVGVLLVNSVARDAGPELSWALGWNVTGLIYALEGNTVAVIQSVATPTLTAFFSVVYLFGYVFLLVFPFVAYLALPDRRPLVVTSVAFATNYALGLCCYVLFISYGPRNLVPGQVESLLYTAYPLSQVVTSQMNVNTNVFPSLHTSLSVSVAALAWRTKEAYPRWVPVATGLAAAVVFSTMYLGIHWATDVVAGTLLGLFSVWATEKVVP